jgi:hypothetical protein
MSDDCTCNSDHLREFATAILPAECVLNEAVLVTSYVDPDGGMCWGVTVANSEGPVSIVVGLLEMAKLDIIARTDTGLPIRYRED